VVGPKANALAIDKACAVGSGFVSVCNTNHYGIAGWYSLKALERGCLGISMTNSTKLVAPFHGGERMLGTNPIAIAFPGLEEPPIVIDFATSATAYGKIEIAKRRANADPRKAGPSTTSGTPTADPDGMIQGGALLPLGSFAAVVGAQGLLSRRDGRRALCCVLSGANWGPFAPPFALRQEIPARAVGKGIGHFFGALRIEAFIDETEFKRQIDDWIRTFRATRPMPGTEGVRIPGDPEREAEADRGDDTACR
jgi:L-2-hydroxycarboxylate dehydrogenase (NAD+)